jgi:hypothetical protein
VSLRTVLRRIFGFTREYMIEGRKKLHKINYFAPFTGYQPILSAGNGNLELPVYFLADTGGRAV